MIRIFRHYIPRSLLLLGIFEILILLVSLYLAASTHFPDSRDVVLNITLGQSLVFLFVLLSVMTAMGLYQRDVKDTFANLTLRVGGVIILSFAGMFLLYYLLPEIAIEPTIAFYSSLISFLGLLVSRYIYFRFANHAFLKRRAIVLGAGKRAARIDALLTQGQLDALNILGFVHLQNERIGVDATKVLGDARDLARLVDDNGVDEVIVALDDRRNSFPIEQLLAVKMTGVEVVEDISFWEKQTGKIEISSLHPSHLIFADGYAQAVIKPISKRIFDVTVSSAILIAALPIMMIAALLIWLESGCKGSIFYFQERVGAGGKTFNIIKFRSMKENAESNGAQWATVNDSRITRIGGFLRKTRIDELPQIINVLRGSMSFVGPRPERPEFVDQLAQKIPYYSLRHGLKPGITGWAQVMFPYGASEEDARQKLQYDLYYMKNYTVFLDIMIIFQTLQVILWQKGSR